MSQAKRLANPLIVGRAEALSFQISASKPKAQAFCEKTPVEDDFSRSTVVQSLRYLKGKDQ